MADIKLVRPSAGQTEVIPSAPDARMVLGFSADQVSIERPQGSDSLFFRFDDGAAIELQNFYTQYNKDDIPSFEVDGQLIAGVDFFNAFGPDLAPAAGPSASATRGGRYSDYANASLENGLNHLDGLDYRLGFGGDTQPNINPYASPFLTNAAPTLSTGGAAIAIGLTESAWDGKSASATPVVSQSGSFSVADPDGDSLTTTVSMGGKVVAVSTSGPTTVASDYGTLVITPSGGGSNITFTYTYTLKQTPYSPTDSLAEGEKQADNIIFSINDGKGHTVTQPINVVITGSNDAPDITGVGSTLTLKEAGVYADQPVGDKLHADELNGAPGVQATLSGIITAHDPDHGAQLYFGLKDGNGNLLDMTNVNADGSLKGTFVIGSVNNPDHTTSDVVVTGIAEQGGQIVISTNYGDLVLGKTSDTTAMYTFTLKNTDGEGATNKLAEGQQVSLKFEPYVRDEHGAVDGDSATLRDGTVAGNAIVINILGTNDVPTITQNAWDGQSGATALSATLTEASDSTDKSSVTGTIIGHDVDNGDSLHYGLVQPGSDTMHSTVYVVLTSEGLTTTTNASTAATAKNYVGEFTLTENAVSTKGASYTFTLYNGSPAVQGMQDGDSRDVSIGLVARDSFGAYVQESVSVTIKGANDKPTITTAPTHADLSVEEAGVKLDADGNPNKAFAGTPTDANSGHSFTVTDVDNKDTQTVSIAVKELPDAAFKDHHDGTYTVTTPEGTFTLKAGAAVDNDSGSSKTYTYSYELNNDVSATQALHENEEVNYTFTVTVTDSKRAQVDQEINLTIKGTNDQPVLTINNAAGTVTEDASPNTFGGTWSVADPDNDGSSQTLTVEYMGQKASGNMDVTNRTGNPVSVTTDYGTLTLKSDGTYTYVLDNSKDVVQSLGADQKQLETFTVTTTDIHGANTSQVITITIEGTNDVPVINNSSVLNVAVVEDGVYGNQDSVKANDPYPSPSISSASGHVDVTDVDANDKGLVTFSVAAGKGTSGSNTNSSTVVTDLGILQIDDNGVYTYTLNADKSNKLNEGQKVTETFVVKVADGHGGSVTKDITVNITGTNDRPVLALSAPDYSTFTEDVGNGSSAGNVYTATGTFTVDDKDADGGFKEFTGKVANQSYSIAGGATDSETTTGTPSVDTSTGVATFKTDYGILTVRPNGSYEYDVTNNSNAVQNLAEGQTHTETFKITVKDLHGSTDTKSLIFTIKGTNDKPFIEGDNTHGTLTVKEAGVVSPNDRAGTGLSSAIPGYNNVEASGGKLNDGSNAVSSGSFTVTDMDTRDVLTATLSGGNIASPVIMKGDNTWSVTDDYGKLTITSVRSVSAADGSESITYKYSYEVDQTKADALTPIDIPKIHYSISVTDGSTPVTHDITINVQGTNDAPTVSAQTLTLKDNGVRDYSNANITTTTPTPQPHGSAYQDFLEGKLTGSDADSGDSLTYGLVNATSGADAYKHLGTGMGQIFEGSMSGTLTPNANKLSDISADFSVSGTGAYPGAGGGKATVVDVYASGHRGESAYHYGALYLNEATGMYVFELDKTSSAVNNLGSGDTLILNFQAVAVDGHSASSEAITLPIVIYGTNDRPTLTLDTNSLTVTDRTIVTASSQYDAKDTTKNNAHVFDPDAGDGYTFGINNSVIGDETATPKLATSFAGNYGTFSINAKTGQYTYTIANNNAAVIALGEKESLTETFKVVVVDKFGAFDVKQVTVTINGYNDTTFINTQWLTPAKAAIEAGVQPIQNSADADNARHYANEKIGVAARGFIGATDADTHDKGDLLNSGTDGNLQYHIEVGNKDININKTIVNSSLATLTKPEDILSEEVGSCEKYGSDLVVRVEHGYIIISKYDVADAAPGATTANHPAFTYIYHADDNDAAVQALQENGAPGHDTFSVVVRDSSGTECARSEANVTINGSNDQPVINATSPLTLYEDGKEDVNTGQVSVTDVDKGDASFTYSLVNKASGAVGFDAASDNAVMNGKYGYLSIDQNTGKYTYHRYANVDDLNVGEKYEETFYVRAMDAHGAYSYTAPITVTITGDVNNPATISGTGISYVEAGVKAAAGVDEHGALIFSNESGKFLGHNAAEAGTPAVQSWTDLAVSDVDNQKFSFTADSSKATIVDSHGKSIPGVTLSSYGTFSGSDGNYKFSLNSQDTTAIDALKQGETVTIKIPVTATSTTSTQGSVGDVTHSELTVTITGTNDAPVVSGIAPVVEVAGSSLAAAAWHADFASHAVYWPNDMFANFLNTPSGAVFKKIVATEATRLLDMVGKDWSDLGDKAWANIVATGSSWLLNKGYSAGRTELATLAGFETAGTTTIQNFLYLFQPGTIVNQFLSSSASDVLVAQYFPSTSSTLTGGVQSDVASGTLWFASNDQALSKYVSDVDHDHKLTFFAVQDDKSTAAVVDGPVVQSLEGKFGTLIIKADGTYDYIVRREDSDYVNLAAGAKVQEHFQVYARDEYNAVAKDPIDIVINLSKPTGGGGLPSASMDIIDSDKLKSNDNSVKEDSDFSANGTVRDETVQDNPNYDDALYVMIKDDKGHDVKSSVVTNEYGTLTLLPNGDYTFTLNNDSAKVQELYEGQKVLLSYTVKNDKETAHINITIEGTNDTPYIKVENDSTPTLTQTKGVWVGGSTTAAGHFTVGDVDTGDTAKLGLKGGAGYANVDGSGSTFTVHGKYGDYTVTRGTDGQFTYTYTLSDPTTNYRGAVDDPVKFLITDNSGAANNAVEHSLNVHIKADADLGSSSVTLAAKEDSGSVSGNANFDAGEKVLGSESISYAIAGDDKGMGMLAGKYGTLLLKPDGSYEYVPNNSLSAIQSLGEGVSLSTPDTFTIYVKNGSDVIATQTITAAITGKNDAPSITLHQAGGVAGSGALLYVAETAGHLSSSSLPAVSGQANAYDVDYGDSKTFGAHSAYGTAVQAYVYKDANGNLVPCESADPNAFQVLSETVYAQKDNNGNWVQCANISGSTKIGTFSIDASTGVYTFTMDKAAEALAQGDKLMLQTTVTVTDGNATASAPVQISVTGANTAPVITQFTQTTLTDNGTSSQSFDDGKVSASDADGDKLTFYIKAGDKYVTTLHDTNGTLTIDPASGNYTFAMDQSYASKLLALGAGASASGGNFTIVTLDKYGAAEEKVLSITLQGVNNAPTFTAPNLAIVEGASPLTGSLGAADVDTNDAGRLTYSLAYGGAPGVLASGTGSAVVDGHYGQLTLDASGNYKYTVTNHALAQAQNDKDTFTVTVTDGHGGSVSHDIVINVTGTNDAPVVKTSTYDADTKSGTFTFTDADLTDSHTLSVSVGGVSVDAAKGSGSAYVAHTAIGTFTFTNTGAEAGGSGQQWEYAFAANAELAASIRSGMHEDYTVNIGVTDNHVENTVLGTSFNIEVEGTNAAPVVSTIVGDIHGGTYATDGDALTFSLDTPAHFGTVVGKADGTYSYTLHTDEETLNLMSQAPVDSHHITDSFGFSVNDGAAHGTPVSGTANVSIDLNNWDGHNGHLFFGTAAGDTLDSRAETGNNILYGGGGDDILYGGAGHNQLYGGDGNDTLYAGSNGDHLYGGKGNDHLYGGAGDDHLYGGAGNDFLDGGLGHNELHGGEGNDLLVFHQGDTIDGGGGLDFLLTSNPNDNLQSILGQTSNVEVAIKGGTGNADAPLSLTSLTELLKQGITVTDNSDGSTTMTLNKDWSDNHDGTYTNSAQNLTLSTAGSLASEAHDDATEAAKFILTNSHA